MPPFLPQAVPQAYGDVSNQINQLGNSLGGALKQRREQNALMSIGQAAATGDLQGAQRAAFLAGRPDIGLQVNQLLAGRDERAEDRAFRTQQADQSQRNADRSFGLQEKRFGATQALQREQFEFEKFVQSQNFQLKMREIDAKNAKLDDVLTPGQKEADKKFADEYVKFKASGGFADVDKQLGQLEGVLKKLESGDDSLTGPFVGSTPDVINAVINPGAIATRERVEEVVQRNLRIVLGAQFTEREGERLIARAYNPRLSEKENASRLRALITQIRTMAKQKQAASEYFEKNGTIVGFSGEVPGMIPSPPQVSQPDGAADPLGIR